MSWAAREPDEPLEDWMLRLQISQMAAGHQPARITLTQVQVDAAYAWADRFMAGHMRLPAQPGLAYVAQRGGPSGWVIFRHYLPDTYSTSGGPL